MPDLKERYSDAELDRSNKAFDELVSRPDMQALNDRGDAVARDLRDAESNPGSSAEGGTPKNAEAAAGEAPDNRFNYQKQPGDKPDKGTGWSRRRKLVALGIGGGGLGGLLISLFMLLPLKVPGMIQMVTDIAGQRVEQITEKRAKLILGRAILTKFGSNTGVVLTGEGAFKSLVASMRTSSFEKRLAANGLKIIPDKDGVKLTYKGAPLGDGKTFKNEKAIMDALDSNKLTNRMVKDIVKEDIPSWRWMKRAKFARWLRIKYGIPRYGLQRSDKDSQEERNKDYDKQRVDAADKRTVSNFSSLIKCLMSGTCDKVDETTDPSKASQADAEAEPAGDAGKASEERGGKVLSNGLKGLTGKFSETLLKVFGSKAIPIVGWIDIVATIDNMVYKTGADDYFGKLVSYYRGASYAAIYAEWAGYGSQIQLGDMETPYVGQLATELDGAEMSAAFQNYQGHPGKGTPVEITVDSSDPSVVSKAFKTYTESDFGIGYRGIFHPVMHAYYETVGGGGFLGWLSGKLGSIIGFLLQPIQAIVGAVTPDSVKDLASNIVKKIVPYLLKFFGLTVDAFDTGPKLFNNIAGGAEVSTNQYCKEIGCRHLSDEQVTLQNTAIAREKAEYLTEKSLAYRLFSKDEPSSLTSQLAVAMPSTPTATVASIGHVIAKTPLSLLGLVTPRSSAAQGNANIFKIAQYGATTADLNRPLSSAFLNGGNDGEGCPEVADGEFNDCKIDTEVTEAMTCEFEPDSADCSDTDTPASSAAATTFTVASYNILHSENHTPNSISVGGCNKHPVAGDPTCGKTRAARQAQIITGQAGGNPAFDLIATQETSAEQYTALKGLLPGYGVYPDDTSRLNNAEDGAVAVFWNTAKFSRIEAGKAPGKSNTSKYVTNPWVGLQSQSGKKVYFMSVHYAIKEYGGTDASIKESSSLTMDWVRSKATGDNIVIVGGDFNDALGQGNSYCVYTQNSLMQHAVDMAAGADPSAGCSANRFNGIDHIYATPTAGLTASNWVHMADSGLAATASDHTPVYVTYTIPGGASSSLNIATFNILHVGDSDFEKQWRTRLPTSIQVLKSNSVAVAGLQEVRPDQHDLLTSQSYSTDTFDIFPKTSKMPDFTPNPIIWNKSMYTLVSGKTLPIEYDNGNKIDHAVLVRLKGNDGNEFYVLNTHDPANARPGTDQQNALSRLHNTQFYTQYLGDLSKEGKPVFLTGDFNASYTMGGGQQPFENKAENLAYCVINRGGVLKNVWDILEKTPFACPRAKVPGDAPIDHIYTANTLGVTKVWTEKPRTNGSDHPTVMATVILSGQDSSHGGGVINGWAWPLGEAAWKAHRAAFLGSHYSGGGFLGTRNSSVDISWGESDTGSPIYSMLDGVVKTQPLGRSSYTCTGSPNSSNNGGMLIESKLGGHTIQIVYAHGSDPQFHAGDSVKAGQQILKLGNVGNSCGSHLHMDMTYDGKNICLQDVFLALGQKQDPSLDKLTAKATATCAGR